MLTMKKAILIGLGSGLLIVGLVMFLFPFIPGILFVILGLTFCSKGSKQLEKQIERKIKLTKLINIIKTKLLWQKA